MGDTLEAALQALITGLLFALTAGGIGWAVGAENPLQVALIAGSLAGLLGWLAFRDRVSRLGDYQRGYTPPAAPVALAEVKAVRVEIRGDEGRTMDYLDLGISLKQLQEMAAGLTRGDPFSQAAFSGDGKPLSRAEFDAVRIKFIGRGLARWRNEHAPAQGAELTPAGRAAMRYLTTHPVDAETNLYPK